MVSFDLTISESIFVISIIYMSDVTLNDDFVNGIRTSDTEVRVLDTATLADRCSME